MTGVFWLNISLILLLLVKSNPAKPTVAYAMHVCREPQDDGYTLIPSPEKTVLEINESELSLTFESSSDTPKRKKTPSEVRSQKPTPFQLTLPSRLRVDNQLKRKTNWGKAIGTKQDIKRTLLKGVPLSFENWCKWLFWSGKPNFLWEGWRLDYINVL